MNIKEIFKKAFGRKPMPTTRGIGGAVAKIDNTTAFGAYFTPIIARAGIQKSYKDFSEEVINQLSDSQIRDMIKAASPIVAKAVADYADAVASGFTWTSDRTIGQYPETPAQQLLEDFLLMLETEQGGIEGLISEMARGAFTHGGYFTELIIAEDGVTPLRLKVLDPTTARYRKNYDEAIGEYYELGQDYGFGNVPVARTDRIVRVPNTNPGSLNFKSLHNDPTIQYRPLQKEPNNPYGVPILDPAVFHVIMMAGFFDKFNAAITGHVWPNLLISIDVEKFKANAGGSSVNTKELETKLAAAIKDIQDNVGKLQPGQALIQGDDVTIGGSITGQSKSPMGSIKDIQDVIRRELIIAVQSQPILMGSNEAIAETHAIEQIKAYGKLIRRSQKTVNALFTDYFNLILVLNGYPPLAEFRLSYVNTADYKDQAATFKSFREGLKVGSEDIQQLVVALQAAVDAGFMTQEEAQLAWDEEMEIRRQLNILPQDL